MRSLGKLLAAVRAERFGTKAEGRETGLPPHATGPENRDDMPDDQRKVVEDRRDVVKGRLAGRDARKPSLRDAEDRGHRERENG